MSLTKYERETIVCFTDDSKTASVYTSNKKILNKLNKYVEQLNDESLIRLVRSDEDGSSFEMPKKFISFRKPKHKAKITEEERQRYRQRLACTGEDDSEEDDIEEDDIDDDEDEEDEVEDS